MVSRAPPKPAGAADGAGFEMRAKRGRPRGKGTQIVYDALREEILTLRARPGDHLDETQLEKRFGVSRTPIREALIRLQADRLVRFSANRGHFVEVINFDEMPRIFEAMDLYQGAVLRLAAARRTSAHLSALEEINEGYRHAARADDYSAMAEKNHQFHVLIGEAAGNRFVSEGYATVLNYSLRMAYLMFEDADRNAMQADEYYGQIYDEHARMIALLKARDADALERISEQHTRLFCSRVAAFMQTRVPLSPKVRSYD